MTHFSKSIQYRTISYEDRLKFDSAPFLAFCDFLKQTYSLTDTHLKRQLINNYSILYKWEGNDPEIKPIILTAHYDVVPVEESSSHEWTNDPYSGEIDNGFVWGRGTMDNKLVVIGIMEAIELLLEEGFIPERTIYIAFGYDEEILGHNGAKKIVEHLKHNNVRAEFVLDEGLCIARKMVPGIEKDVALIGISKKGYLMLASLDFHKQIHITEDSYE